MLKQFTPRPNQHREGENPPEFANYLYLRYANTAPAAADARLSDGTVPPSFPFYYSPDIRFDPHDIYGNPVAGRDVTVTALIHNFGHADAIGVYVEFCWFNPSLVIVEANRNVIGSKLVTVPDHNYATVVCPKKWRPTFVNGGHECLVVQCQCPGEGTNGLKHPYEAYRDRHVGQLNLTVSPPDTRFLLQLQAPNPFAEVTGFTVEVSSWIVWADLESLRQLDVQTAIGLVHSAASGQEISGMQATEVTDREFEIHVDRIERSRIPFRKATASPRDFHGFLQAAGWSEPDKLRRNEGRVIAELNLTPGEMAVLNITGSPVLIGSGLFLVHHFSQVVNGYSLGGYSVVVPPPEFEKM